LDSDSVSIQTCFLNLLLEFTRTSYLGNLYPIGLPDLTRSAYLNLTRTAYLNFTQAPYPSLTRSYQYLPGLICSYPAELPYPILLPIRLLLTRPYMVLPGRITLLGLFPIGLLPIRSYPATLPDRVTLHCTRLLIQPYPITLPSRVPFNWPHSKTSSSASHLDLGLFWSIMLQNSSGNPKPTRVTLNQSE
jgi:hypothetical protein